MSSLRRLAAAAALTFAAATPAVAQNRVLVSENPWGETVMDSRFEDVFGAGAWTKSGYGSLDASTLFSATNAFVWLEGGAASDLAMQSFLDANGAAMTSWVAAGGRLVLNSAGWNTGMSTGFGDVSLVYGGTESNTGTAVDPTHAIFTGPFGNVGGTAFSGNYFSHDAIVGSGFTALMTGGNGQTILAEQAYGSGLVLFGGLTTDNFHTPQAESQTLTRNIIAYAANGAAPVTATPEPASVALMASGLLALGGVAARRRQRAQR